MNGLVLSLGNAPNTWHTVEGYPGYFHPKIPVPVDAVGFPDGALASAGHKAPGCPLKLVKASAKDLQDGLAQVERLRAGVVLAIREQRRVAPVEQVAAEESAAGIKETP